MATFTRTGMENFWSLLEARARAEPMSAVEPFHLFRYVDEQVFRYNHRNDADGNKLNDAEQISS